MHQTMRNQKNTLLMPNLALDLTTASARKENDCITHSFVGLDLLIATMERPHVASSHRGFDDVYHAAAAAAPHTQDSPSVMRSDATNMNAEIDVEEQTHKIIRLLSIERTQEARARLAGARDRCASAPPGGRPPGVQDTIAKHASHQSPCCAPAAEATCALSAPVPDTRPCSPRLRL